jgi:hypothetical protein
MSILTVSFTYPINDPGAFGYDSQFRSEQLNSILVDFIRSQSSQGPDLRPADDRDIYKLTLALNLQGDSFSLQHDCGNDSLALGIILDLNRRIDQRLRAEGLNPEY